MVLKDEAVDGSVLIFESMCLVGYKVAFTIPFWVTDSCRKMLLHIAVLHVTAICHKNNVDMKNAYMDLYSRHRIQPNDDVFIKSCLPTRPQHFQGI